MSGVWSVRFKEVIESWMPYLHILLTVFGFLQFFDSLDPIFYVFVDRAMVPGEFELGVELFYPLFLLLMLWVLWALLRGEVVIAGVPLVPLFFTPFCGTLLAVSVSALLAVAVGFMVGVEVEEYLFWIFLMVGVFNALVLVHWVLFVPVGLASPLEFVAVFERDIAYLSYTVSPFLVLTLIFIFVFKPLFGFLPSVIIYGVKAESEPPRLGQGFFIFVLVLSVIASVYPLLPTMNPEMGAYGVDILDYVKNAAIVGDDVAQAFNISGGSRPLVYLVIYGVQKLTGFDSYLTTLLMPVLLNPLLVLSIYLLTLEVFHDSDLAYLAAFFMVCSYQVTAGLYGFLISNMLSLSLIYFSLYNLFRALRAGSLRLLGSACLFGVLLVFTHPWTFDQYCSAVFALMIFLAYKLFREGKNIRETSYLFAYLLCVWFSDVFKVMLLNGTGALSAATAVVSTTTSLPQFWPGMIMVFNFLFGGLLSNVTLLFLVVVAVLFYHDKDVPSIYLTFLTFFSSLVFLIGNETIKSRVFFNMPLSIFAVYGFIILYRLFNDRVRRVFFYSLVSGMLLYLFRSLANLV